MLADVQWTVYPEEVTHLLHVMVQDRESSLVIDQRSNTMLTPPTVLHRSESSRSVTIHESHREPDDDGQHMMTISELCNCCEWSFIYLELVERSARCRCNTINFD